MSRHENRDKQALKINRLAVVEVKKVAAVNQLDRYTNPPISQG